MWDSFTSLLTSVLRVVKISAHIRDGGVDKNAGDDYVKSRAGDALGGTADDECGDRAARRVRDGDDADESAASPPNPAHYRRGVLLVKGVLVCGWTSCLVYQE